MSQGTALASSLISVASVRHRPDWRIGLGFHRTVTVTVTNGSVPAFDDLASMWSSGGLYSSATVHPQGNTCSDREAEDRDTHRRAGSCMSTLAEKRDADSTDDHNRERQERGEHLHVFLLLQPSGTPWHRLMG